MKATLILCDHAQVAEGKLNILGGGWNVTSGTPANMALAVMVDVPWDRTNTQIRMQLELREADGSVVHQPGPAGQVPVRANAEFEVGRPPGVAPGTAIPVPFAIPVLGLQLAPGARFYWELSVDDETRDDWTLHFGTRALPPGRGGPADIGLPGT